MRLNALNSKSFFGTESLKESQEVLACLQQGNVRCQCDIIPGSKAAKHNLSDPFHVYAKYYLKQLFQFYIIRVHRFDFQKAIQVYNDSF